MKKLSIGTIRKVIHGSLVKGNDNLMISSVVTQAKQVESSNTLLFLLNPRTFDWRFIKKYLPCAIVTDRPIGHCPFGNNCTIIKVNKIKESYYDFIDFYRNQFDIPVIAVTGTCGKTTTKDMTRHILKHFYKTEGTVKSTNGESKHLSYLMKLNDSVEAAVYETAVAAPGCIKKSSRYFKPQIGIITNIGIDHLDQCKTLEGYIKAKGEMVKAVGEKGTLILNADDDNIKKISLEDFKGKIIYYGVGENADYQASNIEFVPKGMSYILTVNNKRYKVFIPGYGVHQVYNSMAAIAAAYEVGISYRDSIKLLPSFKHLNSHFEVMKGLNQCQLIVDTWNINPTSLEASIKTMCEIAKNRKKIALVGSIDALGKNSRQLHQKVGDMICQYDLDVLITIGFQARYIALQCRRNGFKGKVYSFSSTEGVRRLLNQIVDKDTTLLTKCSMHDPAVINFVNNLKLKK